MSNDLETLPEQRVSSQDRLLQLIQKEFPGYHPVLSMVRLANSSDDESIAFGCHKEVARYVVAVDRYVEVKQEVRKYKRVTVELFGGPEHPSAIGNEPSPVLDVHGREVQDAVARPVARGEVELVEQRSVVRSTGPAPDEDRPRDRLLGAWGDGAPSDMTARFA